MTALRRRTARGLLLATATATLVAGLTALPAHATGATREACYNAAGVNRTQYWPTPNTTLRLGSRGICVRELQEDLRAVGVVSEADAPTFADGIFGQKTLKAVRDYQNQWKTQTGGADGVVGPKTWNALISMTTD